jgi:hypothetical protein
MAYYIFLKSLTSLEEFRKNCQVKIPPKSPCANFQSLGIFKNPIFNSEILFLDFGPASSLILFLAQPRPTSSLPVRPNRTELVHFQNLSVFATCLILLLVRFLHFKTCPIRPHRPQATAHVLGPLGPSRVGIFAERRILFDFAHSGKDTFSLSHHYHVGIACQFHPLPPPPADRCHSSPLATPRRPASNLEMPSEVFTPRLDFPLNFTP